MKTLIIALTLCAVGNSLWCQEVNDKGIREQVVKIFSSRRSLNLSNPWKRGDIDEITGSGVWLGEGRILTNAHMVLYSSQLYVQPFESSDRIVAETIMVSPEMDLAIIKLEDASAFENIEPLEILAELPELRSAVQVYGYPTGGNSISVTEGVVSRIEYTRYLFGQNGLRIQVDAALNPGNSGGPAIVDGKIAGLVYSRLRAGDNIGYLIPGEEIEVFFADMADGQYDGKPTVQIQVQRLQNDALRQRFGLTNDQTGLLVVRPLGDEADYPLQPDDVITHAGPHDIDNEGMVRLDNGLRLAYSYFVPKLCVDGRFPATIVRNGETLTIDVPAGPSPSRVIRTLKGEYPEYFVYGPLVFIEATSEFVGSVQSMATSTSAQRRAAGMSLLSSLMSRESPLIARRNDQPAFDGEQIVMVAVPMLPHRVSKGYRNPQTNVLDTINGVKIKNMTHLVEQLRDMQDDQIKFEFADRNVPYIVLNREEVDAATEDILVDNGIARQGSKELLKLWMDKED